MIYRGYKIEPTHAPIPAAQFCAYAPDDPEGTTLTGESAKDAKEQIDERLGECLHQDTDRHICSSCNGSGDGLNPGSFCTRCMGSGEGEIFCVDCGENLYYEAE